MASLQAHLLSNLLKCTFKRRLARERDITRLRRLFNTNWFRVLARFTITQDSIGGIPGEWVSTAASHSTLLYLHGGGFCVCSPKTHRPITCAYAEQGFRVFVPAYRLAPEHPFPAAVEDASSVYLALLRQLGKPFAISGESAGGGLVLATMLSARAASLPLPTAAALFSPWTDLAFTGESIQRNARHDSMFNASDVPVFKDMYLQGADPRNPLASPLYADLTGLPPLLIHVGDNELLLDDSLRLADSARQFGVSVTLKTWPVVPHAWQQGAPYLPEAVASLREAATFLTAHFSAASAAAALQDPKKAAWSLNHAASNNKYE